MEPGRDDFHDAGRHLRHHAPALGAFHGMMMVIMIGTVMTVLGSWALGSVVKV